LLTHYVWREREREREIGNGVSSALFLNV